MVKDGVIDINSPKFAAAFEIYDGAYRLRERMPVGLAAKFFKVSVDEVERILGMEPVVKVVQNVWTSEKLAELDKFVVALEDETYGVIYSYGDIAEKLGIEPFEVGMKLGEIEAGLGVRFLSYKALARRTGREPEAWLEDDDFQL